MSSHVPPQDLDMEEYVLGCALYNERALQTVLAVMSADDFLRPAHRIIFETIAAMNAAGDAVDEATLIDALRRRMLPDPAERRDVPALELVGGSVRVMSLVERVPAVANARQYCEAVKRMATMRRVIEAGVAIQQAGFEQSDDAVQIAEQQVFNLVDRVAAQRRGGDAMSGAEALEAWEESYGRAVETGELEGTPWPVAKLQAALGPQLRGSVIVTGGYSGDGKTWWGLDCVERELVDGGRALIVTMEMPAAQLIDRWVAMGGHPYGKVVRRELPYPQLAKRREEIRGWRCEFLQGASTVDRVRAALTKARLERDPFTYVLVDHIHLLEIPGAEKSERGYQLGLNTALSRFKTMAGEFGVTMHLLAQLSRVRPRKLGDTMLEFPPPLLKDLKETSALEQIADVAVFVWRERDQYGKQKDSTRLIVAKGRAGDPIAPVKVVLNGDGTWRFRPPSDDAPAVAPATTSPQEAEGLELLQQTFGARPILTDPDVF